MTSIHFYKVYFNFNTKNVQCNLYSNSYLHLYIFYKLIYRIILISFILLIKGLLSYYLFIPSIGIIIIKF